ncbi:MAG: HAD-IIB family hydrolase [bacterium]|nr:HAD-IIB family hydrolase [bacterium]
MEKLVNSIQEIPKDKNIFVFDLDGTLAESKVNIDSEMGELLAQLLIKGQVAIIGGAKFEQMKSQLPENISKNSNLFLLPLDGGSFYTYPSTSSLDSARDKSGQVQDNNWHEVYSHKLSDDEVKKIKDSFEKAFEEIGYIQPSIIYGEIIENRGGQVTFSSLGQRAPLEEKEKWAKENNDVRVKIESRVKEYLPEMEVKIAGLISIDVTKKGIDKKFGIEQIIKHLGVTTEDVLFFGDAMEPAENDYPALESGVACYKVNSVQDTKDAIKYLLD